MTSHVRLFCVSANSFFPLGSHSPGPRALSMGVYPIQAIKSQILDQSEVRYD